MNKAFEKILERLEDVERILLNEAGDIGCTLGIINASEYAKQIVQEVAEEYNDGWIPCSERLPDEYAVLCCDRYGEYLFGHPYFDEVSDTNYSCESGNEIMYDCVAWMPLIEPYKE